MVGCFLVQDVRKAEKAAKDEEHRQADLRSYKNVMTVSVAANALKHLPNLICLSVCLLFDLLRFVSSFCNSDLPG